MPALSDRLKSLGVKVGAQELRPAPKPQKQTHIEDILGARQLITPMGNTFVVENFYAKDYLHGKVSLITEADLRILSIWARESRLAACAPESIAFIDIETTGLFLGPSTYTFLICIGRIEGDTFHLAQFFMHDPSTEVAQLSAVEAFLAPCQVFVTFNGKAFDAPHINSRFTMYGLRSPLLDMAHIDLYHLARRLWNYRLAQRRIKDMESQILGSERATDDISGWEIPEIYYSYMHTGDPEPLIRVFYHNRLDVLTLAGLFNYTANLLAQPLETDIQHGVDLVALARLFEDINQPDTAVQLYLLGLEYEPNYEPGIPDQFLLTKEILLVAIQRLASIYKRANNYQEAVYLWEKATQYEHLEAYVELAKYYEHHVKDISSAYHWTEQAIHTIIQPGSPATTHNLWLTELQHRLERLHRKLNGD